MTITIPATFNQQLNRAFFNEFTPENPSADPVFSRVTAISLHCLYTGVMVLSCQNPVETKYRVIPQARIIELREAVRFHKAEDVNRIMLEIFQEVRTNPETYHPRFYILPARITLGACATELAHFAKLLPNYSLDEQGIPNNPYMLLDLVMIPPATLPTEWVVVEFLIKGQDHDDSERLARTAAHDLRAAHKKYTSLYGNLSDILDRLALNNRLHVPSSLKEKLRTELGDSQGFFREFVEVADKLFGRVGDARVLIKMGDLL